MDDRVTRLAPSPTGALHLGNARTFLVNWLMARQAGWRIVLRIEDLDTPRVKTGAAAAAIEDLAWLGLDFDGEPVIQTTRANAHAAAIRRLLGSGAAYACVCSRGEVDRAASAPHAEDGATVYPGTCRGRFSSIEQARAASGREPAIRFCVPEEPIGFDDAFAGARRWGAPASQLGDFVIARAVGDKFAAAYQLAVVVDDADAGVNNVVRGDDLLDSTPRQMLVYRALGLGDRIPRYWHLPLVVGEDGRRLAKRHGDTRLATIRKRQPSSSGVLRLLAGWCGIADAEATSARDLLGRFDLAKLPRERIVVRSGDVFTSLR